MTPRGRKARALLAFLISDAGSKVSRERIAALLWGDRPAAQARSSLRQALLELRRALNANGERFSSDREHVWIDGDSLVEDPHNLGAGSKDAFADLDHITPEFDEWLAIDRNRRSSAYILTLLADAQTLLDGGNAAQCLRIFEEIWAVDPYNEDALRLAMKAEFRCAHSANIIRCYDRVATRVKEDLGVTLSAETRALRDELQRQLEIGSA